MSYSVVFFFFHFIFLSFFFLAVGTLIGFGLSLTEKEEGQWVLENLLMWWWGLWTHRRSYNFCPVFLIYFDKQPSLVVWSHKADERSAEILKTIAYLHMTVCLLHQIPPPLSRWEKRGSGLRLLCISTEFHLRHCMMPGARLLVLGRVITKAGLVKHHNELNTQ